MRDDAVLFIGLLLFRLIISFIKECLTHPDELWQSVEPAYVLVYGKGRLPYDWVIGMRGYFSIIPYVLGMLMAKFLGNLALAAPANYAEYLLELENLILWNWHKVIAAVLGAIMDMCTIKMARRYFSWSRHYDRWVILFLACNGTWFTYSVRAFSNNLEGVFALTALYMWPASAKGWSSRKLATTMGIVGMAVLARFPAIQVWGFPWLLLLRAAPKKKMVSTTIIMVILVFGSGLLLDRYCYGYWLVTQYNFYVWNFTKGLGANHGVESFYFYVKMLYNPILSTFAPWLLFGLWRMWGGGMSSTHWFPIKAFILPYMLTTSMHGHKEDRFIVPVVPLMMMYCAYGAQQIHVYLAKRLYIWKVIHFSLLTMSIVPQLMYGIYHTRYRNAGYEYALKKAVEIRDFNQSFDRSAFCDGSILALGPCYYFPGHAFVNRAYNYDYNVCVPELVQEAHRPTDEQRRMLLLIEFRLPQIIIHNKHASGAPMPAVIVTTGSLVTGNREYYAALSEAGYGICGKVRFHLDFLSGYMAEHAWLRYVIPFEPKGSSDVIYIFCKGRHALLPPEKQARIVVNVAGTEIY